jgi:hypothetical protein
MYVPLHYQVSEYDCVPTAFINAVSYLFERQEIPPMVIRHIYLYTLDTVGRGARLGSRSTSRHAIRLLGHWLASYKFRKFSVVTDFLLREKVHLHPGNSIFFCLEQGGIALCNISLGGREEHYLMLMKVEDGWVHCFDPYLRTSIRGLRKDVRMLKNGHGRSANLKIRVEWMDREESLRFCLGPAPLRECLLIWRTP